MTPIPNDPASHGGDLPLTTMHVARAVDGDGASLEWLVARLSPLLREHARFRLGGVLRRHYDPDDLVHDAWMATLPKLQELVGEVGDRRTPVLLKYLSKTVVLRIRYLARRHARQNHASPARDRDPATSSQLVAEQSGAVTRAVRREQRQQLHDSLAELEPRDREVLLLRGIEQLSASAAASVLGIGVEAVHKRFQRALSRLRARLPESVFSELSEH